MKNKNFFEFLIGIVLMLIGGISFLQHIVINSFHPFFYMFGFNATGLLLLLITVAFICFLVKPNKLTKIALIALVAIFFISIMLTLDIRIMTMSAFDLILILGTLVVGLALVIRSLK